MEEIDIMQSIIENYTPPSVDYMVVFNPDTGEILKIGPRYAFTEEKHTIPIDIDTATKIIEGTIRMSSCTVSMPERKLKTTETKTIFGIDDVLHRIADIRWTTMDFVDIYLTYNKSQKTLMVELAKHYGGTKVLEKQNNSFVEKTPVWDSDTKMNFLITDYNDPNILYELISINLSELINKSKIIENIELPEKFSIYTRRLFENYMVEIL